MKMEIGYELKYDYWKDSLGQGSWQTMTTFSNFSAWDGEESFHDMVEREHPGFVTDTKAEGYDRNHRMEITSLRIGGEKSQVIVPVERQVISLQATLVKA